MFVCLLSFKCAFYSQMRQYSSTKNRNKHCCVSFLIASDSFSKLALLMCVCQTTDGLTWASEKRFCSTDIIVCLTCLWCMEPYPRSLIRLQSRFWFVAIRISFISQIQDRNELVPPFPVLQHRVSLGPVCGAPRISSHWGPITPHIEYGVDQSVGITAGHPHGLRDCVCIYFMRTYCWGFMCRDMYRPTTRRCSSEKYRILWIFPPRTRLSYIKSTINY